MPIRFSCCYLKKVEDNEVLDSDDALKYYKNLVKNQYRPCRKIVSMERKKLLEQIKQAVLELEPEAEIILYGSRSRRDAVPESDWDLLILVSGPINDERTDRIRHRLYEIEWETGEVISSIVRNHEDWNSGIFQVMPFHRQVVQEGVRL